MMQNRKYFYYLAFQSLKWNKMRSIFVLLAIALSSSLISGLAITTLAIEQSQKRALQTMQHVIYEDVGKDQIDKLQHSNIVSDILLYKQGKIVSRDECTLLPMYVQQHDSNIHTMNIILGSYPIQLNEVVVDLSYLKYIGMDSDAVGKTIYMEVLQGHKEEFIITGITDFDTIPNHFTFFFSESYANDGYYLQDITYQALVRILAAEKMTAADFRDVAKNLAADCGIMQPNTNLNNTFVSSLEPSTSEVLLVFVTSIVVLLASFVVIYSIFYISIVSRTRYFGQMRTLGMTSRQLKKLLRIEGLLLCVMGTPIGLIIGCSFAYLVVPDGFDILSFLCVCLVVFAITYSTIMLALKKPAKIATSVSAIDATKVVNTNTYISKNENKKSYHALTPWTLAHRYIFSNRQKFAMTIISLGIGGVLFLSSATMLVSINQEEYSRQSEYRYGEYYITSRNISAVNNYNDVNVQSKENPITDKLVSDIYALDNINSVITTKKLSVNFEYNQITGNDFFTTFTVNDALALQSGIDTESIDYKRMVDNKEIIVTRNSVAKEIYGSEFKVGDSIKATWFDGVNERNDIFTIAACVEMNDKNHAQLFSSGWFMVPEELVFQMVPEDFNINKELIISVDDYTQNADTTQEDLRNLLAAYPSLKLETLTEQIQRDASNFTVIKSLVLGLSLFIISFSLINLLNTLITNVIARKHEFSVLQSIGMKKQQLALLIKYEGLIFTMSNMLLTLTLGTSMGFVLILILQNSGARYLHYQFPTCYFLAYAALVFLLPVVISKVFTNMQSNKSLLEHMRDVD